MNDRYLDQIEQNNRLLAEWRKYGSIIVAYDFDDTVFDYHKRGDTYVRLVDLLRRAEKLGAFLIVFTGCSQETILSTVRPYLRNNQIPFQNINEDGPVKSESRKIYFNILLDDRAGLVSAFETLRNAVETLEETPTKF